MSSDDSNKTVFRQPAGAADRTVMRPRPGGRGNAPAPQTPLNQPMPDSHGQAQPYNPVPTHQSAPPAYDTQAAFFRSGKGLNPLVNAASTLIAVFE